MKRKTLALLLLFALGSSVQALETSSASEPPKAIAKLQWTKIRGQVIAMSPETHMLQITDKEGNIAQVSVDKNVQILRYYRVVDMDALKLKDRVELRYLGTL